jgi:hypothetical protein
MPLPVLTEDEHVELVRLLRDAIAADRYFPHLLKFGICRFPNPRQGKPD